MAFATGRARRRPPTGAEPGEPADPQAGDAPADQPAAARAIVLRLLTGAAKSRAQLEEALAGRGISEDVIAAVLDRFTEVGLVDDTAFAEAWVRSRAAGRGERALRCELRAKGVAEELIDSALGELDADSEEERARALAASRARSLQGLPAATQIRRLTGLLQRRGYSGGVAFRVAREVVADEAAFDHADPMPAMTDGSE